jgi:hypothetical protein
VSFALATIGATERNMPAAIAAIVAPFIFIRGSFACVDVIDW